MSRVFANGLRDQGRVMLKTQKMVLDAALLNAQHYKVQIKGKVEQHHPLHLSAVAIEKGAFGLHSTVVAPFIFFY